MQPFVIPVKGLKDGVNNFSWHAGDEFFANFENSEIIGADLRIDARVDFDGCDLSVECKLDGTVKVVCDRCMDDLVLEVHTSFTDDEFPDMREIDLSQDIYDYTCISLPIIKTHPDGGCNPDVTKYLNK